MYTATIILPVLEWLGIRLFELVTARNPQRNEVLDDDDDQVGPRSPILPNSILISSVSNTVSVDNGNDEFTSTPSYDNDVIDWNMLPGVLSSGTYDDLRIDFSDGNSEAADDEDYEVMCDDCPDCIARNLARHNGKGYVPVINTASSLTPLAVYSTTWNDRPVPSQDSRPAVGDVLNKTHPITKGQSGQNFTSLGHCSSMTDAQPGTRIKNKD